MIHKMFGPLARHVEKSQSMTVVSIAVDLNDNVAVAILGATNHSSLGVMADRDESRK
jgi:hypothetical protein